MPDLTAQSESQRSERLPDPNTIGWWALKDGHYVEFAQSERFASPEEAGAYFYSRHGFGTGFHHGNRAGLIPTPSPQHDGGR